MDEKPPVTILAIYAPESDSNYRGRLYLDSAQLNSAQPNSAQLISAQIITTAIECLLHTKVVRLVIGLLM